MGNIAKKPKDSSQLIVKREAVEVISALKLVASAGANLIKIAEPDESFEDAQVLGVAINAAIVGAQVEVLLNGVITDLSFNFPLNSLLYLGDNGTITDVQPTTGYRVSVGKATGINEIYIEIQETIEL